MAFELSRLTPWRQRPPKAVDGFPAYRPPPEPRRRRPRRLLVLVGLLFGGALGYAMTLDDPMTIKDLPQRLAAQAMGPSAYTNCAQVRLIGAAPLRRGQPGYSRKLDTDGNGVACESFFGEDEAKKDSGK